LRTCIINPRSNPADIETLVRVIRETAHRMQPIGTSASTSA